MRRRKKELKKEDVEEEEEEATANLPKITICFAQNLCFLCPKSSSIIKPKLQKENKERHVQVK